jgi:hypothetical protein
MGPEHSRDGPFFRALGINEVPNEASSEAPKQNGDPPPVDRRPAPPCLAFLRRDLMDC